MLKRELSLVQTSAGGGTRARPLSLYSATTMIPKGMMRVMGIPIAEIQLEQAKKIGIRNVYVVAKDLENRDQLASRFSDGRTKFGMNIKYSHPIDDIINNGSGDALLTNISRNNLSGDSLVLSNDNLFEYDIDKILRTHRDNNAVVTILTIPMSPRETIKKYGLIDVDENGKVKRILEKPKSEEEIIKMMSYDFSSDLDYRQVHVNTAGYVLNNSLIDKISKTEKWIIDARKKDKNFDMAGSLLTGLVNEGFPIFVEPIQEWGDLGSLHNYIETTKKALSGSYNSIDTILYERNYIRYNNSWVHTDSMNKKGGKNKKTLLERLNNNDLIIGPNSFIGRDCILGDGCIIKYSDIEKQTAIGENSYLTNSVIFPYSIIGDYAEIDRTCLALNSYIDSNKDFPSKLSDGSAIGPQVKIQAGSNLRNTIIFPGFISDNPINYSNETIEPSSQQLSILQKSYGK